MKSFDVKPHWKPICLQFEGENQEYISGIDLREEQDFIGKVPAIPIKDGLAIECTIEILNELLDSKDLMSKFILECKMSRNGFIVKFIESK